MRSILLATFVTLTAPLWLPLVFVATVLACLVPPAPDREP